MYIFIEKLLYEFVCTVRGNVQNLIIYQETAI